MSKILLLTTIHGFLTESLKAPNKMADVAAIVRSLEQAGYSVQVRTFEELNDYAAYTGWFVIYASSEDLGLFYKSYIEDVLLTLMQVNAILLPRFELLRAHHNKSYMEMRRSILPDEKFKTVKSRALSSADWLKSVSVKDQLGFDYPMVVKSSAGAGALGVKLVHNERELQSAVRHVSNAYFFGCSWASFCQSRLMFRARQLYRWLKKNPRQAINTAEKFVVQSYIEGLNGDYKVLVFGEKYFILERKNRDNDFRASGSGKFVFPTDLAAVQPVLTFAKNFYRLIDSPLCSLDIGMGGDQCHLLEFQCLNFGPFTLEFSPCWFESASDDNWIKIDGESVLEEEYARTVVTYIENYNHIASGVE